MKFKALAIFAVACLCASAQTIRYNPNPSRSFGQPSLTVRSSSPNLVEGREFYLPQSVAVDTSVSPNILYVADTVNNRVLAWSDINAISRGDMATKAIGQADLSSTRAGGPGSPQAATGLATPTAVGVDSKGNLYVADSGNNRILRFPKPLSQTGELVTPDMVIGQHSFSSDNRPNENAGIPSAKTLYLTGSAAFRTSLVFDSAGNLWAADPGNNRVLRYPVAALNAGTSEPAADLVLGQQTFDVSQQNEGNNARLNKNTTINPSGIAFSESGDLYVSDARGRVLYYKAPITTNGQPATRILGIPTPTAADPNPRALNGCPTTPPQPCESALGTLNSSNQLVPPEGLAVSNNSLFVADTGNNRIVKFDTPDKWAPECVYSGTVCPAGTLISPPGIQFIGQPNGQSIKGNQGGAPSSSTLVQPTSLRFVGANLWVADSGNNRVLMFPPAYVSASKVLGQLDFGFNSPNLIEGRELFIYDPITRIALGGMAVDTQSNPPHLYISDGLNNRILGFRDARNVKPGDKADMVIGQPDLFSGSPNFQTRDASQPSDASLSLPIGLLVDSVGDLFVADSGNGRVLRFSRPFDQVGLPRANLVLGQSSFTTHVPDPSSSTMAAPWGLALTTAGYLAVSDSALNRVVVFKKPAGGDFVSGQRADIVVGQPDFLSFGSGNSGNRFNAPRGIGIDSSDRLYVADTANNRVSIFSSIVQGETDPSARFTASFGNPFDVKVNSRGETWVTDTSSARMLRFPIFEDWFATGQAIEALPTAGSPIAVALDANDNPIFAETVNRVSFYFQQATWQNFASYVTRGITPGMLAYLYRYGPNFGTAAVAQSLPLPKSLSDLQVLVDGKAAPIYQVLPSRVDFQVPWSAGSTGNANVQLVRQSTGEVLAAGTFPLHTADPALFTANQRGFGQLAASNEDGTVNSPSNPAKAGSVISLYGTGTGPIDGAPPDGEPAPSPISAPGSPQVSIGTGPAEVLYFGLVNWFPGVFQINARIPTNVPPSGTVPVGVAYKDYFSTQGPNGLVSTTIAVKQ